VNFSKCSKSTTLSRAKNGRVVARCFFHISPSRLKMPFPKRSSLVTGVRSVTTSVSVSHNRSFCSTPLSKRSNPVASINLTMPSSIVRYCGEFLTLTNVKGEPHLTWSTQRIFVLIVLDPSDSKNSFAASIMYILRGDVIALNRTSRFPGHLPRIRGTSLAPNLCASRRCFRLRICIRESIRSGIEDKHARLLVNLFR
jgi:hypothetical protein